MNAYFSKKRVLSLFMALVLCLSMVPAAAFADTTMYAKTSTGESVNIHSTQDFGAANVVGHVPYSGKVTVISNDGTWAFINYNKTNGYVLSSFLVSSEPVKKSVTSPAKTSTMYVSTSNGKSLNMRSSMTTKTSNNIVGYAPNGKKVTVLSTHGSWSYIKYGDKKGYVLNSMLTSKAPTVQKISSTKQTKGVTRYIVTGNKKGVNLRSSANKKAGNILLTIPYGGKVTAYETSGSWTRVKYGTKTGYVMSTYLSTKAPSKK